MEIFNRDYPKLSSENECVECGGKPWMSVNIHKDFKSLGKETACFPERASLCFPCTADYMTTFNILLGKKDVKEYDNERIGVVEMLTDMVRQGMVSCPCGCE